MPDITMCRGGDCPFRVNCYRFTASPTPEHQSWFIEPPYDDERYSCDFYLSNGNDPTE
jgi:hypothetical protein